MPKSGINDNVSAVRKLELSQLDKRAMTRGGMAKDTDIESFALYLSSKVKTNLVGRIIDAEIERTIEGASSLTVTVSDDDGTLLNSGLLTDKLDVQIDGLWFRFASININEGELELTFEDREIAVLREYSSWKIARRANTTRAEFILNLIREVREFKIPVVIPELHVVQPVEAFTGDILGADPYAGVSGGIPKDAAQQSATAAAQTAAVPAQALTADDRRRGLGSTLTVKGSPITQEQIANANTIIAVGKGMPEVQKTAPKKLIQAAMMTAIIESTLHNLTPAKSDPTPGTSSAGLFQQQNGWGSLEERMDPATSARLFYLAAIKTYNKEPDAALWLICADTQHPREDLRTKYADAQVEAARIMGAYGEVAAVSTANNMQQNIPGGSSGTNYAFWRGNIIDRHGNKIRKPENSWSCIIRLAHDVDWRAFFVAGTFYYMSESDLFKQKPLGTVKRYMDGVSSITASYDRNKKSGQITLRCAVGKWAIPPGSVVKVVEMGPCNGRWLVNDFRRSLFSDEAEITLKKPQPALPEPRNDDSQAVQSTWYDQPAQMDPGLSGQVPSDKKAVIKAVFADKNIQYSDPTSQKTDISTGAIDIRVLQFLLYMSQNNWGPFEITALKSDHSKYTSEGNLSAHGAGRAVDIGTYNEGNPRTDDFMKWVAVGKPVTGFDQLIGPNPLLVIPIGIYDAPTLAQHKNHCHIGWHL